jgi:hypothetical protein
LERTLGPLIDLDRRHHDLMKAVDRMQHASLFDRAADVERLRTAALSQMYRPIQDRDRLIWQENSSMLGVAGRSLQEHFQRINNESSAFAVLNRANREIEKFREARLKLIDNDLAIKRNTLLNEFGVGMRKYKEAIGSQFERASRSLLDASYATRRIDEEIRVLNERNSQIARFGLGVSISDRLREVSEVLTNNLDRVVGTALASQDRSINKRYLDAALGPISSYGAYAHGAIERLAVHPGSLRSHAIEMGLGFARQQLAERLLMPAVFSGSTPVRNVRKPVAYNLFDAQERDLNSNVEEIKESRITTPSEATTPGLIHEISRNCVDKIIIINENSNLLDLGEVIPLTNRIWESGQRVQFTVAESREALEAIIDALFFIFYEGAGAQHLRFKTFDLVSISELTPIFHVKFLRNKWLRHDPDHGPANNKKGSFKAVGDTLEELTGIRILPNSRDEYMLLQLKLVQCLNGFLDLVLRRLHDRATGH